MTTSQLPQWTHEYNEGWDDLVNTLVTKLYAIDPKMEIFQIKEKFGGLRAYIDPSHDLSDEDADRFNKLIREAEDASYEICDRCGKTGRTIAINGWYMTVCEEDEAQVIEARRVRVEEAKAYEAKMQKEQEELKASTECMECGESGIWRKDIKREVTVLCDEHYTAHQERMKELRKEAEIVRAEIQARKQKS